LEIDVGAQAVDAPQLVVRGRDHQGAATAAVATVAVAVAVVVEVGALAAVAHSTKAGSSCLVSQSACTLVLWGRLVTYVHLFCAGGGRAPKGGAYG